MAEDETILDWLEKQSDISDSYHPKANYPKRPLPTRNYMTQTPNPFEDVTKSFQKQNPKNFEPYKTDQPTDTSGVQSDISLIETACVSAITAAYVSFEGWSFWDWLNIFLEGVDDPTGPDVDWSQGYFGKPVKPTPQPPSGDNA